MYLPLQSKTFSKVSPENMMITWNIRLFIFCMICSSLKYKGFTVYENKFETEKYDEGWLFVGRFKVGSVLGMINKKVLAKSLYKPA